MPQAVSESVPHIQQACPTYEEEELQRQPIEEEEKKLHAKAALGHIPEVQPDIESNIQSFKGRGHP
jgi:hypothetical protein